ncbi:MAG TPA: phosphonate ABC transporter ATP-binding protein [Anaerolineae bacterium]|jgi:phosphonate transport system ATP-binding protein|nr:phosphonate ABC transporter ATP-binding protein [Anaerolineae bacterium]
MLEIQNLTKVYEGGTVALRNVSFIVNDGEFMVIVGLSGSGKSTLLRCINRLIEPTEGRVIWNGIDITALSGDELRKIRRQIGMIFQQFNLVKRSSVMTNVLSGRLGYVNPWRSALGRFPKQDVAKAWKALETVGILDQANKRADELSGGQQQRVGIARALMQDPQLLLADEPVASLDPATSHSILKYLEQLNRELGVTVLCSLHFLSLARAYGTRLIALKDGEVVFEGLPAEIDDDKFRDIYGQEAVQVEIR